MKNMQEFTKEEYLEWVKKNGNNPPSSWEMSDCYSADLHIRNITLKNFKEKIQNLEIPESLKKWIFIYVEYGFGSGETDELLKDFNCYPDYMF